MKEFGIYAGAALLIIGVLMAVAFFIRLASSATAPVSIVKPAPHIECVKIVTGDGVAIDCNWGK